MINISLVDNILKERKNLHPDDPALIELWDRLTGIFIQDEDETIAYLKNCSKENVKWISEIFEDISLALQSTKFIDCIEELSEKYPDLDLYYDILFAKSSLK